MGFKMKGLGGAIVGGIGGPLGSVVGGMGGGKLSDLLLGKKSEGVAGGYSSLDPAQQEAYDLYRGELGNIRKTNPEALANLQVNQAEKMIRSGAEDQERNAATMIAQRGLGKSSVGINALLGARRDLNDRILANRATAPQVQQQFENLKLDRLGALSGGINNILGTRFYTQPEAGGIRGGGLLGLGLGAAGAYGAYKSGGNPVAGFQAGQGIGRSVSNFS